MALFTFVDMIDLLHGKTFLRMDTAPGESSYTGHSDGPDREQLAASQQSG
jgi:hypothetical protein